MTDPHANGWDTYKRYIVSKLDEIAKENKDFEKEFQLWKLTVSERITKLETKAGILGFVAGSLVSIAKLLYDIFAQ